MKNSTFVLALLITMAILYGSWTYLDSVEEKIIGPTSEGQSCLPGTDECIESCARGKPLSCPNPGGTPRMCDCSHPWNQ